jgi:aminodeoxyfutalosine deaminase
MIVGLIPATFWVFGNTTKGVHLVHYFLGSACRGVVRRSAQERFRAASLLSPSCTLNSYSMEPSAFIRRLPKAELHLHLEGTVTPETLVELSARHEGTPLALDKARALYEYTDFTGFLMAFKAVSEHLRTADDYELITWRMLERLAGQGVVHAEVYVSVGVVYYWRHCEFEPLFIGMERARKCAEAELGISVYWIFDAVRHFGTEEAARVFRKAAEMRREFPSIIGIGIGGDERRAGAEPFRELYAEAREAGLRLTAHAGETVGPEGIWGALNIGAERLGHALSAVHDPDLMELLAERQVPLEICVTSNLRTGCCARVEDHPLRRYFDAGLMVTLNSDDPALFHSDLANEYRRAQDDFAFTEEHLRELASNSIEACFLPPERKVMLLRCIESLK